MPSHLFKNQLLASSILASLSIGFSNAAIVISEIDLANNRVELVNTGTSSVDLTNYWWCNRENGSPFYQQINTTNSVVDAGLSTGSLTTFGAGDILVLDISASFLPDINGELGLYNTNTFGASAAIEDYVLWGNTGVRDAVAEGASIWTDNEFIDVSGLGAGDSIQLRNGELGNSASEYFLGASSFGVVPEPSSTLLLSLGAFGLGLIRKRK